VLQSIHRFSAFGLVALGAVHAALALCMGELSTDVVWFAGVGLALVFLGLLNVAAAVAVSSRVWAICRVANILGVAFGIPAAIAVWELQGYVGLLLLVTLAITSFLGTAPQAMTPPELSRTAAWVAAGAFAAGAVLAGYMFVGCVADHHPWFQIGTWGLLGLAFVWAAWASIGRIRNPGSAT
jgi:hypothetical protein